LSYFNHIYRCLLMFLFNMFIFYLFDT
jgi:hypothetical protein